MNTFDPSADGVPGYKLAQTVRAAQRVVDAFDVLEKALHGCMAPLNLAVMAERMQELREEVAIEAAELMAAADIIELDLPMGHLVSPSDANRWSEPEYRTLEPFTLIQSREIAVTENVQMSTYREWAGAGGVPELIRQRRARQAEADAQAARQAFLGTAEERKARTSAKRARIRAANRAAKVAAEATGLAGGTPVSEPAAPTHSG